MPNFGDFIRGVMGAESAIRNHLPSEYANRRAVPLGPGNRAIRRSSRHDKPRVIAHTMGEATTVENHHDYAYGKSNARFRRLIESTLPTPEEEAAWIELDQKRRAS